MGYQEILEDIAPVTLFNDEIQKFCRCHNKLLLQHVNASKFQNGTVIDATNLQTEALSICRHGSTDAGWWDDTQGWVDLGITASGSNPDEQSIALSSLLVDVDGMLSRESGSKNVLYLLRLSDMSQNNHW